MAFKPCWTSRGWNAKCFSRCRPGPVLVDIHVWNVQYRHTEWSCWSIVQNIFPPPPPKKDHFTCTTKYIYKIIILRRIRTLIIIIILKNRNQIEMRRPFCSASGDVNDKRRRRRGFGVRRLWLRLKHSDYSPSLSHCIQQTEGMEIKQWANYTFLKIVICLFFFLFYTAVGVFFFFVVLFCSCLALK